MSGISHDQIKWIYANGDRSENKLEKNYPFAWSTINAENFLGYTEPTAGSLAAVLFKLLVGENYPQTAGTLIRVLASDVEFINSFGENQHRLDRLDLNPRIEKAAQDLMIATYTTGPFSVSWIMTYALQDFSKDERTGNILKSKTKIIDLELLANFPALSTADIEANFLPSANSWLKLIELAGDKTELKIRNKGETQYQPISQQYAEMLIAEKVLPPNLFWQLLAEENKLESEESLKNQGVYQQLAVSLLGLSQ